MRAGRPLIEGDLAATTRMPATLMAEVTPGRPPMMVPAPRYPTAIGTGADGKGTANTAKPDEGLAAKAIDNLADGAGSNEDRASRKRGLPKGPEEFRGVRRSAKGRK